MSNVSLKRRLIRALDTPLGRPILAAVGTRMARRTDPGAKVFYEGVWLHRTGSYTIPDSPQFDYYGDFFALFPRELETMFRNATDNWFYSYRPKAGDTVIDIGAGRGEDSLPFSEAVGPAGRVVAIEADPNSFELLRHLCRANRLVNVAPIHAAVIDGRRKVQIEVAASIETDTWLQHSLLAPGAGAPSAEVQGLTLDEICDQYGVPAIDLLKMNIEGAEKIAISGMTRALAVTKHVCIACHDFRADRGHGEWFRSLDIVRPALEQAGFRLEMRDSDPRDYVRNHVYGSRQ